MAAVGWVAAERKADFGLGTGLGWAGNGMEASTTIANMATACTVHPVVTPGTAMSTTSA